MLHWASLIIFFVLGALALWVANTFLQKYGLYLFCIIASVVASYFAKVQLFYKVFSIQMVVLPIIFLALFMCYYKYGKKESIRLFYIILISQVAMFVLKFFEFSFLDIFGGNVDEYGFLGVNGGLTRYLSWEYLSSFVGTVIAFGLTSIAGYFFLEYVDIKKVPQIIRTAIYLGIFSIVNSLLFIIVAYSGYFSFVDILLTFLLYIAFDIIMALLLGCVEWLINKFSKDDEEAKHNSSDRISSSSKGSVSSSKLNDSRTPAASQTKTISASSSTKSSTLTQTKPTTITNKTTAITKSKSGSNIKSKR